MKRVMANNLDLSFLTEDEYQAVLKVIQRDSELKQKDSERIRTVQKSIQDEKRRKLVTGQWFDEVKAKRYRNALLGVDLIKASIREEKPIKHETTEKTEQQQVHQAQSCPHPTLPQAAKYETTSVATDEATEEPPDEVEKDKAKRQIKPKSTFGQEIQRTSQNGSWESGSDDSSTVRVAPETLGKGRQRDFTGPNVSTSISESTSDWQNQTKSMSIQHPQTYQTPRCSDKSTHLQSNVSRIPRRINSVGTSGDLCRTGEPASSNANILEQAHLSGQGLFTVTTVASPVQENVLDMQKPKKTVTVHYKGAPTYQIPANGDKKKTVSSSITHIPKWKNRSKESEAVSAEKLEDVASEPVGSQELPAAIANEDQQTHQPLERLNLSPTSRIPRLKNALETTGENSNAPVEDLKQSSKELPGKNRTAEVTDQGKAAFQPTSRIVKYQSSSSDDEGEKGHKPGAVFTISALSNKHSEEEGLTDPSHFKNLKHFWEKGVDSNKGNNDTSKIPFRKVRSPDHRSSPTEMKHFAEAESNSNLLSRESLPTSNTSKLELRGNLSGPYSSEEEEKVVQLTRTSKLTPVPAPRTKTTIKVEKNDALVTNWVEYPKANTSIDEASKTFVQRTCSSDDQAKDHIVPESIEHGKPTTARLSSNSSSDESLPVMKNNQNASVDVVEETVKEKVLPPKEDARKEMHKKLKKLAAESALYDPASVTHTTAINADDDICKVSQKHFDSSCKQEIKTSLESGIINLQEECLPFPKDKKETTSNFVSTLDPEAVPVKNELVDNCQVEGLVNRLPDIYVIEPDTTGNCNKLMMPRSVSEESTKFCKKAHSGDTEVQTSSTEELQCAVSLPPVVDKEPLALTDTYNNDDNLTRNAVNRSCRSPEKHPSNVVHCMDDSESNTDFQRIESGPTYGLSPVMRALARARKSNAKSMDNLSSTLDRETITSLVNENETRGDGSDQSSTDDKPPVIKTPVLEHARVKELSKSVPMLISESESDSASEISFNIGWHRKTPSDASHSSDMASVSSVSGSIMSVYSADFGSIDAQGSVQFALDYNEKNKEFQIYVSQCKDLAVVDEKKGRTDAYVKTYLLPDKARMGKRKTSVKKRNTNPLYNEILKYKIEKSVLLIQKLNLSVWHNDTLGRNSFLGEVDLDLASWDWSNRELNWYLLKSRIPAVGVGVDHRGEINLAIKYIPLGSLGTGDPPTGEVHIWMKNARDLPQLRSSGVDSFVKCYVLPDTSKKSYQKTRIVKKDINPIYNHTIVYDGFRTEDLKEVCVELTVWDHEKLTNHFLGGLRLGLGTGYSYGIPVEWMDSTEEEAVLWQEMMSNPNEWIPGSLALRSRLGGKKFK
ncbi:synaptotagmin-like protein 2 isoform X3 [Pristis pectinata]|uniref:synaptotagmin-like protein 2 isoform X3 n=1 Tax=Pristis pectinata TaxID=685728 RepID=UPI00223CADBC|nr:synaptotagmin-like protein 2 isoform X3 [Pristis pectinata]